MQDLRALFESEYPGKERLFGSLIKPIFSKAKDTSLTDEQVLADSDRRQIKSFSIIAQVRGGFPIVFADVELQDTVDLKRSRVAIQNCVRKVMQDYSNAIIFFHFTDNIKEWRVSYVYRAGTNKSSTSAKRYTYLCGPEHVCRTVSERFETLKGLPLIKNEDMVEAFSVEPLSKEFFDEYKKFYEDFVQYITGNRYVKVGGKYEKKAVGKENKAIFSQFKEIAGGDHDRACKLVRDYVKKLMGRLVFLHFLQKKGWLGVSEGEPWGSGDRSFIQNLFANACDSVKDDFLSRALEPLFFRTLNTDRGKAALAPDEISAVYGGNVRIPYLNGGLFEEDELDRMRVRFKKERFSDLLDFFSRYNFTIDESDPTDKEIGIDPEMLGKIFENLLEDNKDKGAFYTPKEIVQYMCRESLAAYLCADGVADAGKVRRIMERGDSEGMGEGEKSALLGRLRAVKVCDPAVGSGAFPMGMMNELIALRSALGDTEETSEIKKQIVRDNIYGVDIEKGAVDIARLRFWLAIIVDEKEPIPLPNLDYKIMRGNSLLESYTYKIRSGDNDEEITVAVDLSRMLAKPDDGSLDYNEEPRSLLKTNIDGYFDPGSHEHKRTKNDVIKACVFDLACSTCGLKQNSPAALALHEKIWNGTDEFFLWHTWFGDVFNGKEGQGGFDIVIGNPPYVQIKKGFVSKEQYPYAEGKDIGKQNLYKLFVEASYNFLKDNGVSALIVQSSLMCDMSSSYTRELLFTKTRMLKAIEFPKSAHSKESQIFKSVLQGTCVVLFIKQKPDANHDMLISINNDVSTISSLEFEIANQHDLKAYFSSRFEIPLIRKGEMEIVSKVKRFPMLQKNIDDSLQGNINTIHLPKIKSDRPTDIFIAKGANVHKYYLDDDMFFGKESAQVKELVARNHDAGAVLVTQNITGTTDKFRIHAAYAECKNTSIVFLDSVNILYLPNPSLAKFVLAMLNSKLLDWLFRKTSTNNHCNMYELEDLPIPPATATQQKPVIALVDKILAAKKQDPSADTSALEAQIDALCTPCTG
ncbi:MAG: Eco57I restriction-modification methylase domain-containing protein [Treponema sp.]|nr:Eco57I restriction-modification methylase domain-containing protein [Treponema sp.]